MVCKANTGFEVFRVGALVVYVEPQPPSHSLCVKIKYMSNKEIKNRVFNNWSVHSA